MTDVTVPTEFVDRDDYDAWIDDVADHEIEGFLDHYEQPFDFEDIDTWAIESPVFEYDDERWVDIYQDVKDYGYSMIPYTAIVIPNDDLYEQVATAVRISVSDDLTNRIAMKLQEDGYEVID